jgi:outer membrane lipoprotein-sorting protein
MVVTGEESWIYGYDPEKRTAIVPVEVSIFTPAEESAGSEKQREVNADLFRH